MLLINISVKVFNFCEFYGFWMRIRILVCNADPDPGEPNADPDSYPNHYYIIFFVCCHHPLRQNCLDTSVNYKGFCNVGKLCPLMFPLSLTIFLPAVTL
jgi:hypothetical protein